ncbi:DctP family TRAP transporter solute-binding subunit [Azospirillum halopraeferens]|uniref:TRAP transporter substrate-binding protein n=1 Tax=Azospirillum halopraeferens TaxID=34010 RepID=UPI00042786ED|nr:DctP family TRAP transporter solute-binding subunit [Azospirillum halopraeferens]
MSLIRRLSTAAAALAVAAGLGLSPALAGTTLKLGHLNPADPMQSHSGAMAAVFKALVESGTNGEITVDLFSDGQLGKDDEVIQQVRDGVIQASISSAGGIAAHYPLVGVFDVPFAFPNIAVAHKVMNLDSAFGRTFAADVEARTGLKVVGLLDSGGFFAISNSRRPITSVADMKDLRIRTMTLPTHETIVSSLGGRPTPLPWAEVYTALQTGVADGQMNPIPIIAFAKFDEVQKYLTITNHIITPYVWVMNKGFYDGLTAEQRAVVDYAAAAAVDAGRGISRIIEASERGLPKLAKKMEVNALSASERAAFAEATQPAVRKLIVDKFGAEGEAMLNALMTEIETASK